MAKVVQMVVAYEVPDEEEPGLREWLDDWMFERACGNTGDAEEEHDCKYFLMVTSIRSFTMEEFEKFQES